MTYSAELSWSCSLKPGDVGVGPAADEAAERERRGMNLGGGGVDSGKRCASVLKLRRGQG